MPMISSRCPRPIGDHRVDRRDARLHRLMHRLALNDAGGHRFDQPGFAGGDFALAIEGETQRVDHAAEHGLTDRHLSNAA